MSKISPYSILYEDEQVLVVYKQRNVFTIRTADKKTYSHNLYHYLFLYLKNKGERLFVVHRLDYETSGILIFAKSEEMKERLQKCFEERRVLREYECVVQEDLPYGKEFHVRQFLKEEGLKVKLSTPEEGREAITHIVALNKIEIGTVLKVNIETGRRNQIRIALHSLSLTLLGDTRYSLNEAKRMYLNFYHLKFPEDVQMTKHDFICEPLWLKDEKSL